MCCLNTPSDSRREHIMQDLQGRTIMITGATDGIGKQAAHELARRGAELILHGRNRTKTENVVAEVRRESGNENVTYVLADFASLAEVRHLADEMKQGHARLDVLVNNAAIGGGKQGDAPREVSRDGHELRLAVNYLAPALLTRLLLPLLRQGNAPRIVNVSSIGQKAIDFDDPMLEEHYDGIDAYCQSKLAQIMFTFDLAEELRSDAITVNALHPASLMNTRMVAETFGEGSARSTVQEGTDVLIYVATSEALNGVTGAYFDQMQEARANPQAYDAEERKKLRELTGALITPFF